MPSIHIQYKEYTDMLPIIFDAKTDFESRLYGVRDLYDHWDGGVMSFDFKDESDAMLFKLKYGGKFRPNG